MMISITAYDMTVSLEQLFPVIFFFGVLSYNYYYHNTIILTLLLALITIITTYLTNAVYELITGRSPPEMAGFGVLYWCWLAWCILEKD